MNMIKTTYLRDLVKRSRVYFDPHDWDTRVPEDRALIETYRAFNGVEPNSLPQKGLSPWVVRFEMDREAMLTADVSMIEVRHALHDFYRDELHAVFSDDNAENLIFRIKLPYDRSEDQDRDMLTEIKALERAMLETVAVRGISGITNAQLDNVKGERWDSGAQKYENQSEWVIVTSGTNLVEVLGAPHVDQRRTISNDVREVYDTLGVEAVRQALLNELSATLDSLYVNYRHIALLVDTMTHKGGLISIDRYGINRGDIGPLAKCSFEMTTNMLIEAGVFGAYDKVNGVSANIMLGQVAPCGTGDTEVMIDEAALFGIKEDDEEDEEVVEDDAKADAADVQQLDASMFALDLGV
jgi:DNA-directed RNA polymerase II subunit RPB1